MGEFVGGALLGTAFGAVYDGIKELISKNLIFKLLFKEIESSLDSLKPLIEQIKECNTALPYCSKEELEGLEKVIEKGKELVSKCLKVSRWNPFKKYKYANKLLEWDASLKGQLEILKIQNIRDGKKTAVAVQDIQVSLKNLQLTQSSSSSSTKLELPPLPPLILGLDVPLKELKEKLLEDDGVSMLVLTAPGGCGKTTLATKFCQDQDVKDKFKGNIFFVTVSKMPKLELIMTELYKQKGYQVPTFQNGVFPVKWLQKIVEKEGHDKPLLLVLDDVWSGSESLLQKFEFKMSNYKILVTSRSEFPRFGPSYHLQLLDDDNAMQLFHHTAFLEDKSSHIPKDLAKQIVKHCNGFPLAITVVGRSLCGQPIETWRSRVSEWSKGASVLDCEMELLQCLQSSLDALDNATPKVKECLLDLGAFPEDAEIRVTALIDMWAELYDLDEETSSIAKLFELHNRNLALLEVPEFDWKVVPLVIDYSRYVVRQHDLLRELAIYNTKRGQMEQRERLVIEICGNNFPKWWREQKYSYMNARLVSISTDGEFSVNFPNMKLPEAEVLVLNVQSKTYALPEFVKRMDKLKMLLVTNYSSRCGELDNFQLLGSSSNLRSIRLVGIDFSCMTKSPVQLLNVHKLYLSTGMGVGNSPTKLSHVFPNLKEMVIEDCDFLESPDELYELIHLTKLKLSCCSSLSVLSEAIGNLISLEVLTLDSLLDIPVVPDSIGNLKKLRVLQIFGNMRIERLPEHMGKLLCLTHLIITHFFLLYVLPESIGNLVNLEVLSLVSCLMLSKLPESIRNLQKLNFLDMDGCMKIEELPEHIGELKSSLRKLDMSHCTALRKLPESVSELEKLEEVVCDDWHATHLWTPLLPTLRNLRIVIGKDEDMYSDDEDEKDIHDL